MRLIAFLFAICATACVAEQTPESLFDTARSDVAPLNGDGVQLGLVNMTHNVVWDFAHGYSRFGADHQVSGGPLASFPASELPQLQAPESGDSGRSTRRGTVCVCVWYRHDGTCGWLDCWSN